MEMEMWLAYEEKNGTLDVVLRNSWKEGVKVRLM